MDNTHLCMGCMNPLPEGRDECGICGYPTGKQNPPLYLPTGTVLSERYLVGRLLSTGGDAACYIGFDQVAKSTILIREFLPDTLCTRGENDQVEILGGCEHTFTDYKEEFRAHARGLARMRDLPSMIPLYDIFEQNGTAYTIAEYCDGVSLEIRLAQSGGRMRWEEVRPLFMALMTSLSSLHAAGVVHLGICPENIRFGGDGKLRLDGFALADSRRVSTDLKPHLLPGYSAPEQYGFDQTCDALTDVYGMAATIFRTLTGNPPPEANARTKSSDDLLVPKEVAETLPENVAVALFNALQVDREKRTASIAAFREQLSAAPAVSALKNEVQGEIEPEPETSEEPEPEEKPKNNRVKYAILIVVAVFVVLLLLAGVVLLQLFPGLLGGGSSSVPSQPDFSLPTEAPTPTYTELKQTYAVDDLIGKNYYEIADNKFNGDVKLVVEYLAYSNKQKGTILEQDPTPQTPVEKGATVKLVISAGSEKIKVPNVAGWEEAKARMLLEAYGFQVESVKVAISDYERGMVQETDPAAGTELPYGSKITLRVSDVEPTTTTTTTTTTAPPTNFWDTWW